MKEISDMVQSIILGLILMIDKCKVRSISQTNITKMIQAVVPMAIAHARLPRVYVPPLTTSMLI